MRILVFDMEFANGKIPGSVYSLGYLTVDEEFRVLTPPTDLVIDPDCEWNEYVEANILAYPKEVVEASPTFDTVYGEIAALFENVDFAVGFSVSNDIRALRAACARYGLTPPEFAFFDVERLCKLSDLHQKAHGLEGCFRAWCPREEMPENRHRSDVDAYMTARLLEEICRVYHVDADMIKDAYPECGGETAVGESKGGAKPQKRHRKSRKKQRKEESSL